MNALSTFDPFEAPDVPVPDANGCFTTPAEGAKFMASIGVPQTPLKGKIPFMKDWPNKATTDFAQIDTWYAQHQCNFGSVMKAEMGGHYAIETDSSSPRVAFKNETQSDFSARLVIKSGPGRAHWYYKHNAESLAALSNIGQTSADGLSLRLHNEQCVSPGSYHPERKTQYAILNQGLPSAATTQEINWLKLQEKDAKKPTAVDPNSPILESGRNVTLASIAGKLRAAGSNQEEIESALSRINEERCEPPLAEEEVLTIARSISRYPIRIEPPVMHGGVPSGTRPDIPIKTDLHLEDEPDERSRLRKVFNEAVRTIDTHEPRIVILNTQANLRQLEYLNPEFPKPLTSKSLWGLAGEFVEIAYPTTVASREMLLFQVLPMLGVIAGKKFYAPFGSDRHYGTVWTLNIARTADGKGSVKNIVLDALRCLDSYLFKNGLKTNITSGEGLARVACGSGMTNSMTRLLWVMPEMAMLFNSMHREGSVLSHMLREAYDANQLENERSDKRKSYVATNYLLGLMGTTSPAELRTAMPTIDWHNGVANRLLWNVGARTKKLNTSRVSPKFEDWALRLNTVLTLNKQCKEDQNIIDYSDDGLDCWNAWCDDLPEEDEDTLFGLSQGRVKPNCLRAAVLYAQIDEKRLEGGPLSIESRHIEAGIEIVSRSADSTAYYLNAGTGKPTAASDSEIKRIYDEVARKARENGNPEITRTEVTRMFRNKNDEQKDDMMIAANMHLEQRANPAGGGRPIDVWCVNRGR